MPAISRLPRSDECVPQRNKRHPLVICHLSFSWVGLDPMICGEPTTKTMKSIVSFLGGIIFALVVLAGGGYFAVRAGMVPANADTKPAALERWVANTALKVALERETRGLRNPMEPSDENLITGVHLYAGNCAICHGASDAKPSNPAQGFYIEAPQLAKDGVEDDPEAASFWKVKRGIRFTAMPSFSNTLRDEEIWKIAMFLKRMDKLPPAVDAEWKKVPSVAATPPPK
jgi:thiosulfate dehydrogenase